MAVLAGIDQGELQRLGLGDTQITDDGLVELSRVKSLEAICLNNSAVSDKGLAKLKSLPGLKVIQFEGTKITPAGIADFHKTKPGCVFSNR